MDAGGRPVIVVGVSGSQASAAALRWAAAEAASRHGTLRVVWACEPLHCAPYAPLAEPGAGMAGLDRARRSLAALLRAVLGSADCEVSTEVVPGVAERVLVDRSAHADLLVLGSSSGAYAGRSIGAVVRTCLSRARCPVVVVSTDDLPDPGGRRAEILPVAAPASAAVASLVPGPRFGD